jgi:hypothetical protein
MSITVSSAAKPSSLVGVVAVLALASCTISGAHRGNTADFRPSNIYHGAERLPRSVKRVLMLPLAVSETGGFQVPAVRDSLGPILKAELVRANRFEVVTLAPELLVRWTGREQWLAADELPLDFFDRLREETGCDAVLFSELTTYRPYPPLALGWRIQMVSSDGPLVWWALDEVFDASEPAVAQAARRYHLAHTTQTPALTDAREMFNSPRRFAAYSASVIVATCPGR